MSIQNRIEKFRKLTYFSKKAINDFGFKYFIFLAISEFKKYKFSIFKPDVNRKIIVNRTDDVNYNNWMYNDSNIVKHLSIKNFENKINFTIIITLNDSNAIFLKDTLLSINKQNYKNIHICICNEKINEKDIIANINDLEVVQVKSLKEAFTQIKGEYTIFCNSGDVLTDSAIVRIIQKINENNTVELIYSDEDQLNKNGVREFPFFKPSWSPDLFLHYDYISNFFIITNSILKNCKIISDEKTKKYELLLRITEYIKNIIHIPYVLISVKNINYEENKKNYQKNADKILEKVLKQKNISAEIQKGILPETFRIKFNVKDNPKVSIIIPSRDNVILLKRCINSLKNKTAYKNFDVIIIDNNSRKKETLDYLASLEYKIIKYSESFNFAKMNNVAVSQSNGDFILFMNDDVAAIEPEWLSEMISLCQLDKVGAVGPKLVYGNSTIQHAGIAILKTGSGFHPMNGLDSTNSGYHGFLNTVRNCSAVTGACLMIRKNVFDEIGGFDEKFDLYYNDTDLCLNVWKNGYRVIYTPFAKLIHQGSSKIKEQATAFYTVENHYRFITKWPHLKHGDPFYNPNLGWDYKIELDHKTI